MWAFPDRRTNSSVPIRLASFPSLKFAEGVPTLLFDVEASILLSLSYTGVIAIFGVSSVVVVIIRCHPQCICFWNSATDLVHLWSFADAALSSVCFRVASLSAVRWIAFDLWTWCEIRNINCCVSVSHSVSLCSQFSWKIYLPSIVYPPFPLPPGQLKHPTLLHIAVTTLKAWKCGSNVHKLFSVSSWCVAYVLYCLSHRVCDSGTMIVALMFYLFVCTIF